MRLLATDAVVLHLFDYRETSRIVRLITREAGLVSVVARGARRPKNRFGAALDLFASGVAQLALHPTGDLHGLHGFDAVRSGAGLARSLDRFGAANVIGELCLRLAGGQESADVFVATGEGLGVVAAAPDRGVHVAALSAAWRLVARCGFEPSLATCANCHGTITPGADVAFHYRAGGALCARCARGATAGRRLPPTALAAIAGWLGRAPAHASDGGHGASAPAAFDDLDAPTMRAHARILREFAEEHIGDGRPLRAFLAWEERLAAAPARPR